MRNTHQLASLVKKVAIGLAFVTASYLAAALVNASPIMQPDVTRAHPRTRVFVVTPAPAAGVHGEPSPQVVSLPTIQSL